MQSIKEFLKSKQVGAETCSDCGREYKLFTTPHGNMGACKPCEDKRFHKSLNLPTTEEYRQRKEMGFILKFERITNDLLDATVNSYKVDQKYPTQEKAKQAAVDFITQYDGTQSLVLSGVPGIGKSHLSYAINKAIRSKGYKTLFIKSTDLLDAIKETYNYHSNISQDQIFKMINDLDLLVLDDLGGEYEKKDPNNQENETWASDVLYKVVDMRLGKSLITTTNYSESEIVKKYGQVQGNRILSRIMENATAIRVEGADLRRKDRF
jgi:DNA replication protein DnaC